MEREVTSVVLLVYFVFCKIFGELAAASIFSHNDNQDHEVIYLIESPHRPSMHIKFSHDDIDKKTDVF